MSPFQLEYIDMKKTTNFICLTTPHHKTYSKPYINNDDISTEDYM